MLKINLLGKLKIEYLGESLESKLASKTIAMVYLLIANKGRYMSKDKLMVYLWPDSTEDAARYNLRYNLWLLKKVIPQGEDGQTLILSDKESCILNEDYPLNCDLLTIKELDWEKADIEQLVHAKSLFCGNIMEGWYLKCCNEFNEFILLDRMTCEGRHMKILDALAGRYEKAGDFVKALDVLLEMAAVEPENEELALRIMQQYAAAGKRTQAINYYKSFEAGLWNNLNIIPNEEISDFYQSLHKMTAPASSKTVTTSRDADGVTAERELQICGYCMAGVDYFFISDILKKSVRTASLEFLSRLDRGIVRDLGFIQQELPYAFHQAGLGDGIVCEGIIPDVRIIQAFGSFMEILTDCYRVNLQIKNSKDMDAMSEKILDYLQDLSLANLEIEMFPGSGKR